jgi:hypothetical protein
MSCNRHDDLALRGRACGELRADTVEMRDVRQREAVAA